MGKAVGFIKSVITELKLVEWLTLPDATRLTALVLVLSIVIGIIIVAFDYIFLNLRDFILSF